MWDSVVPLQVRERARSDWFIVGFSPRKGDLTLYIKRLADVDVTVLKSILAESVTRMRSVTAPLAQASSAHD